MRPTIVVLFDSYVDAEASYYKTLKLLKFEDNIESSSKPPYRIILDLFDVILTSKNDNRFQNTQYDHVMSESQYNEILDSIPLSNNISCYSYKPNPELAELTANVYAKLDIESL